MSTPDSGLPPRDLIEAPTCSQCSKRIHAREGALVVRGEWVCAACAYRNEHPDATEHSLKSPSKRLRKAQFNAELFDPRRYERRHDN